MSNSLARDDQQLWVLFHEAVAWIAYRSFTGRAFGPRLINQLPDDPEDEEYNWGVGRCALAEEMLLDRAAKGQIRIYARDVWAKDPADEDITEIPVAFLVGAELANDNTFFTRGDRGLICANLAVNYGDLVREFWGDAAPAIAIPEKTARPEAGTVPLRRRGRRPRYSWPDFAAELLRRSISEPPIENQAALERHMQEWCAAKWGAEPAPSEIREWVRPTFRILSRSSAAARAPNGIADDWSPGITEAVGE